MCFGTAGNGERREKIKRGRGHLAKSIKMIGNDLKGFNVEREKRERGRG